MRRLNNRFDPVGPRSAKSHLQQIMATKAVAIAELRTAVEKLERKFEDYKLRAGTPLAEDVRMVILEQLLVDPIRKDAI